MTIDFPSQIRTKLDPLFFAVLEDLSNDEDPLAFAFFMERQQELKAAQSEEDVLGMFLILSQVAFLGFNFTQVAWDKIDLLLAEAESVSAAMTANQLQ